MYVWKETAIKMTMMSINVNNSLGGFLITNTFVVGWLVEVKAKRREDFFWGGWGWGSVRVVFFVCVFFVFCFINQSIGCSHQTPPHSHCYSRHRWDWCSTCCHRPGGEGHMWSCPAVRPLCWCPSAERWWWCHSSPAPTSCQRCASWFLELSCQTGEEEE